MVPRHNKLLNLNNNLIFMVCQEKFDLNALLISRGNWFLAGQI